MDARDVIVSGMDFDVNLYAPQKHLLLSEARAMLRNIAVDMQHLNDLGDISNEAKARFNRTLPSDRITHNLRWKVACAIRKAKANPEYMLREGEHLMQVVNSYNGLLQWCDAWRLRREISDTLKNSPWRRVFDFHDDFHVTLKNYAAPLAQRRRANKTRKKNQELWTGLN